MCWSPADRPSVMNHARKGKGKGAVGSSSFTTRERRWLGIFACYRLHSEIANQETMSAAWFVQPLRTAVVLVYKQVVFFLLERPASHSHAASRLCESRIFQLGRSLARCATVSVPSVVHRLFPLPKNKGVWRRPLDS